MLDLYYKYQPVTWYVGVIEATPEDVAHVIQPLYAPPDRLCNIYNKNGTIDKALTGLQPIGLAEKFLLIETKDGRTALFGNAFYCMVELPTWTAGKKLNVSAYFACKVPNTISRDQRSGAYGARSVDVWRCLDRIPMDLVASLREEPKPSPSDSFSQLTDDEMFELLPFLDYIQWKIAQRASKPKPSGRI